MRRLVPAIALVALMGCEEKKPEPAAANTPTPPAATDSATQPAAQPQPAPPPAPAADDITWTKPEAWKEGPSNEMRLHTYEVAAAEGDEEGAEMSVSRVGGGIEANIKRWEGQFKDSPAAAKTEKKVGGYTITIVEIEGAMQAGGPMMGGGSQHKEGYKMLVAIVPTEPTAYFFKMWGPKKTIDAARPDFDALVGSITKK